MTFKGRFKNSKRDDFLVNVILLKRNLRFFFVRFIVVIFIFLCCFIVLSKKDDLKSSIDFLRKITTEKKLFKKNNIIIINENLLQFLNKNIILNVLLNGKNAITIENLSNLLTNNLVKSYNYKLSGDNIKLSIQEKHIIGKININNSFYLISEDNNIIKFSGENYKISDKISNKISERISDLISVYDFRENFDFSTIYQLIEKFNLKNLVQKVKFFPNTRCNIYFSNNSFVKLPYKNIENAFERLVLLNNKFDIFNKKNIIIDLKNPNKAFIQRIDQSSVNELNIK